MFIKHESLNYKHKIVAVDFVLKFHLIKFENLENSKNFISNYHNSFDKFKLLIKNDNKLVGLFINH